jgi:LysR family transcriptional regulator, glycine cleavage system transcriptional activator
MRDLVRHVDRLQRLVVFDAAARLGSFTSAAAELGLSQPAVTRQVRALERSVGVDLFVRTANRSTLTDAGRLLWTYVVAGFETIETGLADIMAPTGTFVLAAHPGVAQQWLVPRLEGLQEALGQHDLRLWLFDRDTELTRPEPSAAIRVGDGNFAGQSSRLLFPEVVVPIATPSVAAEHGLTAESTPDELRQVPLVHMDDGDRPWMNWHDWFAAFEIPFPTKTRRVLFQNYPMVIQQALSGRGVALGWRPLIDDLVIGEALIPVGPEVRSTKGYYVTWPEGRTSETIEALVDWLVEQANS